MSRDPRVYLEDVLESSWKVDSYVTGIKRKAFGRSEIAGQIPK